MRIRSIAYRLLLRPAVLAVLVAIASTWTSGPVSAQDVAARRLQVPNVVGRPLDQAAAVLAEVGLQVGGVQTVAANAPARTVVRQSPGAGTVVPAGAAVALVVSSGPRDQQQDDVPQGQDTVRPPRLVTVPPLVGQSVRTADVALALLGLRRGQVDSVESEVRPGRIVAQEPAAGERVPRGTPVRLTLARAAPQPQTVAVPDLRGRTPEEAEALLARAELVLGPVDPVDSPGPEGVVVRQRPAAGTEVLPGSRVAVGVARQRLVRVPAVVGQPLARAGAILREAGLGVGGADSVAARGEPGTVVRQSIEPGELVRPGTALRLSVAQGPVRVPDVTRRPLDEAGALLRRARLARGAVDSAGSDQAEGTVVAQSPAAGAEVPPGTAVALTLAQPRLVLVPDVVGDPAGAAASTLEAAGLRAGGVDTVASTEAAETVVRQSPAAGVRVRVGTLFTLGVSRGADLAGGGAGRDTVTQAGIDTVRPDPAVPVPALVGRTLADARATLAPLGLAADVGAALGDSVRWLVASQSPPAGAPATPGTAVRLELQPPAPPVGPGEPGPGLPWRWIVLAALVGAALLLIRLLRKPPAAPPGPEAPPATVKVPPVIRTRGEWDPGAPEVEVAGKLLGGFEVTLGAAADAGEQSVEIEEGALVGAEEGE